MKILLFVYVLLYVFFVHNDVSLGVLSVIKSQSSSQGPSSVAKRSSQKYNNLLNKISSHNVVCDSHIKPFDCWGTLCQVLNMCIFTEKD